MTADAAAILESLAADYQKTIDSQDSLFQAYAEEERAQTDVKVAASMRKIQAYNQQTADMLEEIERKAKALPPEERTARIKSLMETADQAKNDGRLRFARDLMAIVGRLKKLKRVTFREEPIYLEERSAPELDSDEKARPSAMKSKKRHVADLDEEEDNPVFEKASAANILLQLRAQPERSLFTS
jgi:hypothetical protein